MYRYFTLTFLVLCAAPAAAGQLSDELSAFQPLLGTWQCIGQNTQSPQSPAFEFESQFRFEAALGGQFVRVTYIETKNSDLPVARNNVEYWGRGDQAFTSTFFNAFGQRGELSSNGIKDGRLVWAGDIETPNGPTPFEGRLDASEKDRLSVSPTLLLPDGGEFPIARLDCTLTK